MNLKQINKLRLLAKRRHKIGRRDFYELTPRDFKELEDEWAREFEAKQTREDQRAARVCAVFYNMSRDPKKSRQLTELDFMPKDKDKVTIEDPKTLATKFRSLASKFNFKLIKD